MNAPLHLVGNPPRRSSLAVGAFALSWLSFLLLPAPLAVVLAMVALVQMRRDRSLTGRGFAIAAICVAAGLSFLVLALMALLPSFVQIDRGRAMQSEAKSNLKAIHTLTAAFNAEQGHYSGDFFGLQFTPEASSRYAYVTAAQPISVDNERTLIRTAKCSVDEAQVKQVLSRTFAGGVRPGVEGVCPGDCWMSAIAIANLDADPFLDVWSISTKSRTARDGTVIEPGVPYVESDDTKN